MEDRDDVPPEHNEDARPASDRDRIVKSLSPEDVETLHRLAEDRREWLIRRAKAKQAGRYVGMLLLGAVMTNGGPAWLWNALAWLKRWLHSVTS
jgi:hypothetical protein